MDVEKVILDAIKRQDEMISFNAGLALANHYILKCVMHDLARMTPDPSAYLAQQFETLSSMMDQQPIEKESDPNVAMTRETLAEFFSHVEQRVRGAG